MRTRENSVLWRLWRTLSNWPLLLFNRTTAFSKKSSSNRKFFQSSIFWHWTRCQLAVKEKLTTMYPNQRIQRLRVAKTSFDTLLSLQWLVKWTLDFLKRNRRIRFHRFFARKTRLLKDWRFLFLGVFLENLWGKTSKVKSSCPLIAGDLQWGFKVYFFNYWGQIFWEINTSWIIWTCFYICIKNVDYVQGQRVLWSV